MNTLPLTGGIVRGASEVITVDTSSVAGKLLPPKAGRTYGFDAARMQHDRRVVAIRPVYDKGFKAAQAVALVITLRDRNGNYIMEDMPVRRLSEEMAFQNWVVRNLLIRPRFVDWRKSYVRWVASPLVTGVKIEIIYENKP